MTVTTPGPDSSMEQEPGYGWRAQRMASGGGAAGLAIWTDQSQNHCVLRLKGRLCSDTVKLLDRHVDLLGCRSCDEVTIDVEGLQVLDQVGARLLVGFGHYVAGRGGRFCLEGAAPAVESMIALAEIELAS